MVADLLKEGFARLTGLRSAQNGKPYNATVYTCSYRLKQKLMDMNRRHPGKGVLISKDEYAAQFLVPKRYVTVYEPYSEEHRKKDRERVKTNGFPIKK